MYFVRIICALKQARGKPGRGAGVLPAEARVHGEGGHHGAHPLSGPAVLAERRRGANEHAPRAGDAMLCWLFKRVCPLGCTLGYPGTAPSLFWA